MVKTYTPPPEVHKKLMDELKRLFPAHFADANIYPVGKTDVDYSYNAGETKAFVTMNWQRASDFKTGSKTAVFTYKQRRTNTGLEDYWYCDWRDGD